MTVFGLIEVRKLVAVDMAAIGTRLIVSEYALGIVLPFIFGSLSLALNLVGSHPSLWQMALGAWLVGISANYVPLFLHAVSLMRTGTVQQVGGPELAHISRYTVQQAIILVPFFVVLLTLIQEARRPGETVT
jgi:hypothetical protein